VNMYCCLVILLVLTFAIDASAQSSNKSAQGDVLPKDVRGYKVHRAEVELKKTGATDKTESSEKADRKRRVSGEKEYTEDEPLLVRLGEPTLVKVTPLGVTFDVPVIVGAVKQSGDVDRLVFENMTVNETGVTIEDYEHQFKLPNKEPLTLNPPLRIFISTPQAVVRTVDEIFNSKEVWPVTGRIYVCGHFKKYLFKFKRAIPIELNTSIKNPLN
jgi:hypothetical protein